MRFDIMQTKWIETFSWWGLVLITTFSIGFAYFHQSEYETFMRGCKAASFECIAMWENRDGY